MTRIPGQVESTSVLPPQIRCEATLSRPVTRFGRANSDWELEGSRWPNREYSRFVRVAGVRWHVQQMGHGPDLLLVHGTGAATHSWRGVAPRLAERFRVTAPDLPGHGFTEPAPHGDASLPAMSRGIYALVRELGISPVIAVGHSAGAAILARANIDGLLLPRLIVSLNGAFLPFEGMPGRLFTPLARFLASTSLASWTMAHQARRPNAVERLLRSTGSTIDADGIELYRSLVCRPGHVAGALEMMARWELAGLRRDLARLRARLVLVVGTNDATVPPAQAREVMARVPWATLVTLQRLGHLAHEERPGEIAALIDDLARMHRALVPG